MKNKDTLEETAEIFYSEQSKAYEDAIEPMFDNSRYLVAGFIDGAKWQQEQDKNKFSEEEVDKILRNFRSVFLPFGQVSDLTLNNWLEQYKNK